MNSNFILNIRRQRGEIATTMTVLALVLMTLGVVIGSAIVSNDQLSTVFSEAQEASDVTPVSDSRFQVTFGDLRTTSLTKLILPGSICFEGNNPPGSSSYKVFIRAHTTNDETHVIGSAVTQIIATKSDYQCPNTDEYNATIFKTLPEGVAYDDIDSITVELDPQTGNWEGLSPGTVIGTIEDISLVFDLPGVSPSPTPVPEPDLCPEISGKVPQPVIADALANPESLDGWLLLEDPSLPESETNKRKTILTLQNLDQDFSEDNPLIYSVACEPSVQECPDIATKVPPAVRNNALSNYRSIEGWNELADPTENESNTNRRRTKLDLEDINSEYNPESNDIYFIDQCSARITSTPTPSPSPSVSPSPEPTPEPTEYFAIMSIYNGSQRDIIRVKTNFCPNGENCVEDINNVNIPPGERAPVEFSLGVLDNTIEFYTLDVAVQLKDSEERSFGEPINVRTLENVLYDINVSDDDIQGTAETESEAADVSGNKCVNADDAARLIPKLAEFFPVEQCEPEDIDCNGVVNMVDYAYIVANLNKGEGCFYNQ